MPGPRVVARAFGRGLRAALPVIIAVSGAGVVGTGGYYGYRWVTESDQFAVRNLELRGNERVDETDVRALFGLDSREAQPNIFRVGLPELERRLEADPWIAEAQVARQLPDRLVVDVRERHAVALVQLGKLYLAEADGRVFKLADVPAGEGVGLPIVTGLERADYSKDPAGAQASVVRALRAFAIYRAVPGRPRVSEIHLDARRGVVFNTHHGATAIRVGDGDEADMRRRLRTFDAAWHALSPGEQQNARVVYVDNRTRPDRVTVGLEKRKQTDG